MDHGLMEWDSKVALHGDALKASEEATLCQKTSSHHSHAPPALVLEADELFSPDRFLHATISFQQNLRFST